MGNLRKVEKIQYKALKFVYNDFTSSYADLRKLARRPLMYTERQRCILVEVYKCLNQFPLLIYTICLMLKICPMVFAMIA